MDSESLAKTIVKIADKPRPEGESGLEHQRNRVVEIERLLPKVGPHLLFAGVDNPNMEPGWNNFISTFVKEPDQRGIVRAIADMMVATDRNFQPHWWQLINLNTMEVKFGKINRTAPAPPAQ